MLFIVLACVLISISFLENALDAYADEAALANAVRY